MDLNSCYIENIGILMMTLPKNIELCLPVQAMEVSKVHLAPFKIITNRNPKPGVENRPIAPLSYVDGSIQLPCLSILLPNLRISRWDPMTGRIDLDLSPFPQIVNKLCTLQDYIVNVVHHNQVQWLGQNDLDHETIRSLLQPLIFNTTLTLFLHGPNPSLRPAGRAWIYQGGVWVRGSRPTSFFVGQEARICVRLHGICLIPGRGTIIPKYRIQHQVISVASK